MKLENIWEARGLYRVFSGKVTASEILSSNLVLQGDSRFDDLKYVINDFTQSSEFIATDSDIQTIAAMDNAASISNADIKIAIITTSEPLLIWANLYCKAIQHTPYVCKIFANKNDAYAWINNN